MKRVLLPGGGPAIELVPIPAGSFWMGDVLHRSPESDTRPVHEVDLDPFFIAQYAVTNAQFAWFVTQTGYRTTREQSLSASLPATPPTAPGVSPGQQETPLWSRFAGPGRERHPVICVNWIDAAAFATWAGLRLATEAEWEKAARGGIEGADYAWGNEAPHQDDRARDRCNWRGARHKPDLVPLHHEGWGLVPVGSYPPNGYGLYDTSGNAWEWCSDAYHPRYYDASPRHNPLGPEVGPNGVRSPIVHWRGDDHLLVPPNSFRAIRGGAWDNNTFGLRCCERISASAGTHSKPLVSGFRVAASLDSREDAVSTVNGAGVPSPQLVLRGA